MIRTILNAFLILTGNHLNSDLAKEASCFLHTRIIAHLGEKVNQNAMPLILFAMRFHLLREGMKKAAPKDCSVYIQLMR